MDYSHLFTMQKELDQHIESKHKLTNESLIERKIMAFYVELAELANETRCFKFWSEKGPSPSSVILEEYVDGIHFILSVGLEYGYEDEPVIRFPQASQMDRESLVSLFFEIIELIGVLRKRGDKKTYYDLFEKYLLLATALGFTEEDIINAYFEKNKVNYERQKEGY